MGDTPAPQDPAVNLNPANPPADPGLPKDPPQPTPGEEPENAQIRIDKLKKQRDEAYQKLQKFEQEKEKARVEKLKEQGKLSEILQERESENKKLKEQIKAAQKVFDEQREALMDGMTDQQKLVASSITDMVALQIYADSLKKTTNVPIDGSPPGAPAGGYGGYKTRAEYAANDPDGYMKWRQSQRATPGFSGSVRLPGGKDNT